MNSKTEEIVIVGFSISLLCVSSYLVIPLPFTSSVLSLHTVFVSLIGLLLKPKKAAMTIGVYLLMGLIGLPVFAGGTAGAGKLFGPTGGFYFGFLISVVAISLLKGDKPNVRRYCFVTIAIGIPIQHISAILLMSVHNGFNILAAAAVISFPFIPGDILKAVIASFAGVHIVNIKNFIKPS